MAFVMNEEDTLNIKNENLQDLTGSLANHFGIDGFAVPGHSLGAADRILAQNFRHVVLIQIDGFNENLLSHHFNFRDFFRRHFLDDFSLDSQEIENDIENKITGLIEAINRKEKVAAYKIESTTEKPFKDVFDWQEAIKKACKKEEKSFIYARWQDLLPLIEKYGEDSDTVHKEIRRLNENLVYLCESLKESLVFITGTRPSEKTDKLSNITGEKVENPKLPLVWYEYKPRRLGLIVYYTIIGLAVAFLIFCMVR